MYNCSILYSPDPTLGLELPCHAFGNDQDREVASARDIEREGDRTGSIDFWTSAAICPIDLTALASSATLPCAPTGLRLVAPSRPKRATTRFPPLPRLQSTAGRR